MPRLKQLKFVHQRVILCVTDQNRVALVISGAEVVDLINQFLVTFFGGLEITHANSLCLGTDKNYMRMTLTKVSCVFHK